MAERTEGPLRKERILAEAQWIELAQEAEARRLPNLSGPSSIGAVIEVDETTGLRATASVKILAFFRNNPETKECL